MINNVFSIAGFFFLSAVPPYLLDEDKIQIHETQCNAVMLASENDGLIQYLAIFSTLRQQVLNLTCCIQTCILRKVVYLRILANSVSRQ